MADSIAKQIEDIFVAHATLLVPDDLKTVSNVELDELDPMVFPLLSMYYLMPQGRESTTAETGPGEDVDHKWAIYLYVKLTSFKGAQEAMRDLSWKIVKNFREHRLDYSDAAIGLYARTLKVSNPPMPDREAGWYRGSWELTVTAQELP